MFASKEKKLRREFEKIYDQYIEQIFRFVYLKVNSKDDAEDITSKTFLKAWKAFNDEIKNPRAFLHEIARNLIIDYYRKNRPDKVKETEEETENEAKKNKWKAQHLPIDDVVVQDKEMRADERAMLNSQIEEVRNALRELKEDYQNVIIWYYLDELTTHEIADLLNKPENSIRVLVHRAVTSLKKKLDENKKKK